MKLWLILVAGIAFGQTPDYWIGAGASYSRYSAPPFAAGWINVSAHIGGPYYSLSTMDLRSSGASLRTGIARRIKQAGNWTLMAHADGGVLAGSVNGSASVTLGTFSGGGLILYDLGGWSKRLEGAHIVGVVRILAVTGNSVQPVWELGIGRSF